MDHLNRSLLNTFSTQPLDRAAHGRKDDQWLVQQAGHPQAKCLVLNKHELVTYQNKPLILTQDHLSLLDVPAAPSLLGLEKQSDNTPWYMLNVDAPDTDLAPLLAHAEFSHLDAFESHSLRDFTVHLETDLASIYAYASIINHWHQTTRFCTRCGTSLERKEGGSCQQCSNDECQHIEFPRINSAVIMCVTHGKKILLARQESWPEGLYSILAGFVEAGETLESAVQREVMEEVNVHVENIQYHSSQPWPFPNSLMLGYTAEAMGTVFELEQDDITDALWLSADELRERLQAGTMIVPPNLSISHRLMNDWFYAQIGHHLSEFQSPKVIVSA